MKEKMLSILRLAIEKGLDYELEKSPYSFGISHVEGENQIGNPLIQMNLKSLVGHNFYIWIDIEYGEYRKNPSGSRSPVESSAVYCVYTKYVKEEIEKGDWVEIKDLVDEKRGIQKEMDYLDAVKSNVDTIDKALLALE